MDKCEKCGANMIEGPLAVPYGNETQEGWQGHVVDSVICLQKQLVKLQAIVDKMPKTADGVLVEHAMKVYAYDPCGFLQSYNVQGMTLRDDSSRPLPASIPIGLCYSTPELAEAAKEAKEKPKNEHL